MKTPLCHFAAVAGMLLFAWACDSGQSVHPEISETDFRMPSHVLAGEMTAIYASAQLEDAVLYIGGREFPADSWWEDEEGRWGTWITVPDDFMGEYEVSAGYQDGDSESEPEIIGKIEVWQLSDDPYYSTRRPAYADIGGAVLIVNSCKVTRTGIERLVFRDADGTQVKAELSMETGISSGYSCGILEYCSDYDITYPSDGSYIAFREYGSEISEPVVIRNSDGLVVPLSVPDQGSLTGFYSVFCVQGSHETCKKGGNRRDDAAVVSGRYRRRFHGEHKDQDGRAERKCRQTRAHRRQYTVDRD